jgi:hypothetical protein
MLTYADEVLHYGYEQKMLEEAGREQGDEIEKDLSLPKIAKSLVEAAGAAVAKVGHIFISVVSHTRLRFAH